MNNPGAKDVKKCRICNGPLNEYGYVMYDCHMRCLTERGIIRPYSPSRPPSAIHP